MAFPLGVERKSRDPRPWVTERYVDAEELNRLLAERARKRVKDGKNS